MAQGAVVHGSFAYKRDSEQCAILLTLCLKDSFSLWCRFLDSFAFFSGGGCESGEGVEGEGDRCDGLDEGEKGGERGGVAGPGSVRGVVCEGGGVPCDGGLFSSAGALGEGVEWGV